MAKKKNKRFRVLYSLGFLSIMGYWAFNFGYWVKIPQAPCDKGTTVTLFDYSGVYGCKWVFQTKKGILLQPINLQGFNIKPKSGKKYAINYSIQKDHANNCMAGEIIELSCIKAL